MNKLSIVIPAYNEQDRLKETCEKYSSWCRSEAILFEIIIVNNGSIDGTANLITNLTEADKDLKGFTLPAPGKGLAVKTGVLCAKGDYILVTDADCATEPDQILKLMWQLNAGMDIAIGSRNMPTSFAPRSLQRKLISKIMNFVSNSYLNTGISDHFCGFKLFTREFGESVYARQKITGFSADPEILFIAQQSGYQISEVPIKWQEKPGSKIRVTSICQIVWDLLMIKQLHKISA